MKHLKLKIGIFTLMILGVVFMAADHIDAPAVQGGAADITDFYAFQGQDNDNLVFVANLQGLLSPMATAGASFQENNLVEFNIDTNGDNIEDIVIQAIARNGKMYFFGPSVPVTPGLQSSILIDAMQTSVDITPYGSNAIIGTNNDIKVFAGPRDDPFFMDFAQYGAIIGGNASSFNDPGSDTFAGTNVMSIVIEVPKSMVGGSGNINTWVESKSKS
jgi:hypothetical protein